MSNMYGHMNKAECEKKLTQRNLHEVVRIMP